MVERSGLSIFSSGMDDERRARIRYADFTFFMMVSGETIGIGPTRLTPTWTPITRVSSPASMNPRIRPLMVPLEAVGQIT